jgi:hypothetical protein
LKIKADPMTSPTEADERDESRKMSYSARRLSDR